MRIPTQLPKYRHYKPKNLAVVRIGGRDVYLGKYDSAESRETYNRVIAEWLTTGATPEPAGPKDSVSFESTVNEVILAFLNAHDSHYRRANGTPTGELANFKDSLKPLKLLYGSTPAQSFSPKALKAIRHSMIETGLARSTINQRVGRIVHLFKWAVSEEMAPPSVHHGLKTVSGLQRGRTPAKETAPVKPVPDELVEAIRPHVSRQVWAMIELQRLTGMRPGEVVIMRACDLDMSGKTWVYSPFGHKTEHRGKDRVIHIGPRAQVLVRPWLRTDLISFLFSPREAMEELRASQRSNRKTPLTPAQRARRPKHQPKSKPGDSYSNRTYHHAIRNGCRKAGVSAWHPNQLRHNAATWLRKEFDLDTARAILGHTKADTTEIYSERDGMLAANAMEQVG